MKQKIVPQYHQLLAFKAADCADLVLFLYEQKYSDDKRPRLAIEAARAWARGEIRVGQARDASLAAHTAARQAVQADSIAAARCAGHAAAAAHVDRHALAAISYAAKALQVSNICKDTATRQERLEQLTGEINALLATIIL